jgi:hypothetical protein
MNMEDYVSQIDHALTSIIAVIWAEHGEVEKLEATVELKTAAMNEGYRHAEVWMQEEHLDDYMNGIGEYWDTYFGPDKERHIANMAKDEAVGRLQVRGFARTAMCAALLQFAKQGISIVHQGLDKCPNGREINGLALKDIIWAGRNQGLHWEDEAPWKHTRSVFEGLTEKVSPDFAAFAERNMAFEIVRMLDWRDVEQVRVDLMSIA